MANKRSKPTKLTTPFGRAAWCSLSRPSDKFKADGEYSARVLLAPGPETDEFISTLDALYEAAYVENLAEIQKDKPKIESIKRADKPYKRQEDPDTGEQLSGYQVNGRLTSLVRGKSPGKAADGTPIPGPKLYTRRPQVLDSKNKSMVPPEPGIMPEIGAGSIIRLSLDVSSFFTAALGSGVSMRLIGVQVKELVPVGMRDAGFDEVEGFEAPQGTAADPVETIHQPAEPVSEPAAGDVPAEW